MRIALLALMAVGSFAAIDVSPAQARPTYPFCMRTMFDGDDCSYPTYQACQATASGTGQTCFQNPALALPAAAAVYIEGPAPRRRHRQPQGY